MHFTPIGFVSVENTVYWQLSIERERDLVRLTRTEVPYEEMSEIGPSFSSIDRALIEIDRKRFDLLLDLRQGPRRNDIDFETHIDRHRRALLGSFRRTALIVKTAAGLLQVKRHLQQDGIARGAVFMSEEQALEYLERPYAGR